MLRSINLGERRRPAVSMPRDSGVTSSSSTSFTSPLSTPPWMAAPTATTSSGVHALMRRFPCRANCAVSTTSRHTGHAADQHEFVDLATASMPASFKQRFYGASVRSKRSSVSCSSLARVSSGADVLRRAVASAVMNGRLMSYSSVELTRAIFAFSASSLMRCSASGCFTQIHPLCPF